MPMDDGRCTWAVDSGMQHVKPGLSRPTVLLAYAEQKRTTVLRTPYNLDRLANTFYITASGPQKTYCRVIRY